MKTLNGISRLCAAAVVLGGLCHTGVRATEPPPPQEDSAILAALDNNDYRVRQDRTRALLMDEALTSDDIDRLYRQTRSPEQRHRLLGVARHHLIRRLIVERFGGQAGPGSMGLTHYVVEVTDPQTGSPIKGVMVVMTLPGFPAYAALEPGDVIVRFAGEPIPEKMTAAQFQNLIKSHRAGERIDLTVLRNAVRVEAPFTLGHSEALGAVYDTSAVALAEPYRSLWETERQRIESLIGDAGVGTDQ